MRSVLLALTCLFAVALAGSDLTGTISGGIYIDYNAGNVTAHGDSTSINYRTVTAFAEAGFAFYSSIQVNEQSSGSSDEVQADGVAGFVMVPYSLLGVTLPVPIMAVALYFHSDATLTGLGSVSGIDALTGAVSASLSGVVYLSVDEVDPSGAVVRTDLLNEIGFGNPSTSNGDTTNYVKSAVWTGAGAFYSVKIAGIASSVAGFLSTGGAAITPKSIEVVIEFSSISYQSPANSLRLNVLTLTASAEEQIDATVSTLVSGSGPSQVYVHFAGTAVVDGTTQNVAVTGVDVSGSGSSSDVGSSIVQAMVTANSSLHADFRKVSITFPAGAQSISYDPATGFDASIYSGASALVAPVALIFFAAFFLLFL